MRGQAPAVLERLRARTRRLHDAVERELDWQRQVSTPAGYRALLARWWGFHATFEPEIGAALDRVGEADLLGPRRKLHLLRDDLVHLGIAPDAVEALPRCRPNVTVTSRAEALGALYVIEGSTLGGQIIARHVRATLGTALSRGGLSYFAAYGARNGAMWRAFCDELARVQPPEDGPLLDMAEQTFAVVRRWHSGRGRGPELPPLPEPAGPPRHLSRSPGQASAT